MSQHLPSHELLSLLERSQAERRFVSNVETWTTTALVLPPAHIPLLSPYTLPPHTHTHDSLLQALGVGGGASPDALGTPGAGLQKRDFIKH